MAILPTRKMNGIISGFNINTTGDATTTPSRTYSFPQVMERLRRIASIVDYGDVNTLLDSLSTHIADAGTPHNIFPADIATNIGDYLFPGTMPVTDPAFSIFEGVEPLLVEDEYIHAGIAWVTDSTGTLVQPEPNEPLMDMSIETPGLAIFSGWNNTFTRSSTPTALGYLVDDGQSRLLSDSTAVLATNTVTTTLSPSGAHNDHVTITSGDITTPQEFLIRGLRHTQATSTVSFFVKTTEEFLDVTLLDRFNGDPSGYSLTIDLVNGTVADYANFRDVIIKTYQNGWKRVFILHDVTPSPTLDLLCNLYTEVTKFASANAAVLGHIFGIQVTDGYKPAPYLKTSGLEVTHPALYLSLGSITSTQDMTYFIEGSTTFYNTGSVLTVGTTAIIAQEGMSFNILNDLVVGPSLTQRYQDFSLFASHNATDAKGRLNENVPVTVSQIAPIPPIGGVIKLQNVNGYVSTFSVYREFDQADLASFLIGTKV